MAPVEEIKENKPPPLDFSSEKDLKQIRIPESYGTIQEIFAGKKDQLVFLIQDAHANLECQQNHAKILEFLNQDVSRTQPQLVALEGAQGPVVTARYAAIPEEFVRKEVADYFLKEGRLTGAEYFSIFNEKPIFFYGVEERALYLSNLKAFLDTQEKGKGALESFSRLREFLLALTPKIYSKEALSFHEKKEGFAQNSVELSAYLSYLRELIGALQIPSEGFVQFRLVLEAMDLEAKLLPKKVDQERVDLIQVLEKKLPREDLGQFITASLQYRTGNLSPQEYHHYLKQTAEAAAVDLAKTFPNLALYIQVVEKHSQINTKILFAEIAELEKKIQEKLLRSEEEKKLERALEQSRLLINLCKLELSRQELATMEREPELLALPPLLDFASEKAGRWQMSLPPMPPVAQLEPALENPQIFYREALKRDQAMFDNLQKKMQERGLAVAVLVVGGFHAKGLAELLRSEGISHVVIMPRMTQQHDPTLYLSLMLNERTPLEKLLERRGTRLGPALQNAVQFLGDPETLGLSQQAQAAYTALVHLIFSEELKGLLRELDTAKKMKRDDQAEELSGKIRAAQESFNTRIQEEFDSMLRKGIDQGNLTEEQAAQVARPFSVDLFAEDTEKAEGVFKVTITVDGNPLKLIFLDRAPTEKVTSRDAAAVANAIAAAQTPESPAQPLRVAGIPAAITSGPASPIAVGADVAEAVGSFLQRDEFLGSLLHPQKAKPAKLVNGKLTGSSKRMLERILDARNAETLKLDDEDVPKILATLIDWLESSVGDASFALIYDTTVAAVAQKGHSNTDDTVLEFNIATLIELANAAIRARTPAEANAIKGVFDIFLLGHERGHKEIRESMPAHHEEIINRVMDVENLMGRPDALAVLNKARELGFISTEYARAMRSILTAKSENRVMTEEDLIRAITYPTMLQLFGRYYDLLSTLLAKGKGGQRENLNDPEARPLIDFYHANLRSLASEIKIGNPHENALWTDTKPSNEILLAQVDTVVQSVSQTLSNLRTARSPTSSRIQTLAQAVSAPVTVARAPTPAITKPAVPVGLAETAQEALVAARARLSVRDLKIGETKTLNYRNTRFFISLQTANIIQVNGSFKGKSFQPFPVTFDNLSLFQEFSINLESQVLEARGEGLGPVVLNKQARIDAKGRLLARSDLASPAVLEEAVSMDEPLIRFAEILYGNREQFKGNPLTGNVAFNQIMRSATEYGPVKTATVISELRVSLLDSKTGKTLYDALRESYFQYVEEFSATLAEAYPEAKRISEAKKPLLEEKRKLDEQNASLAPLLDAKKGAILVQNVATQSVTAMREGGLSKEELDQKAEGLRAQLMTLLQLTEDSHPQLLTALRKVILSAKNLVAQDSSLNKRILENNIRALMIRFQKIGKAQIQRTYHGVEGKIRAQDRSFQEKWTGRISKLIQSFPAEIRDRYVLIWESAEMPLDTKIRALNELVFEYSLDRAGLSPGSVLRDLLTARLRTLGNEHPDLLYRISAFGTAARLEAGALLEAEVARLSFDDQYHETHAEDMLEVNLFWLADIDRKLSKAIEEDPGNEGALREAAKLFIDEFVLEHESYHSTFDNRQIESDLGIDFEDSKVLEESLNLARSFERLLLKGELRALQLADIVRRWNQIGIIDTQLQRVLTRLIERRDNFALPGMTLADILPISLAFVRFRNEKMENTYLKWAVRGAELSEAQQEKLNKWLKNIFNDEELPIFSVGAIGGGVKALSDLQEGIQDALIRALNEKSPEEFNALLQNYMKILPYELQAQVLGALNQEIQMKLVLPMMTTLFTEEIPSAQLDVMRDRFLTIMEGVRPMINDQNIVLDAKSHKQLFNLNTLSENLQTAEKLPAKPFIGAFDNLSPAAQAAAVDQIHRFVMETSFQQLFSNFGSPQSEIPAQYPISAMIRIRDLMKESVKEPMKESAALFRAFEGLYLPLPSEDAANAYFLSSDRFSQVVQDFVRFTLEKSQDALWQARQFESLLVKINNLSRPATPEWARAVADAQSIVEREFKIARFIATYSFFNQEQKWAAIRELDADLGMVGLNRLAQRLPAEETETRRLAEAAIAAEGLYLTLRQSEEQGVEEGDLYRGIKNTRGESEGSYSVLANKLVIHIDRWDIEQDIFVSLPPGITVESIESDRGFLKILFSENGRPMEPINLISPSRMLGEPFEFELPNGTMGSALPFVAVADTGKLNKLARLNLLSVLKHKSRTEALRELDKHPRTLIEGLRDSLDRTRYAREAAFLDKYLAWDGLLASNQQSPQNTDRYQNFRVGMSYKEGEMVVQIAPMIATEDVPTRTLRIDFYRQKLSKMGSKVVGDELVLEYSLKQKDGSPGKPQIYRINLKEVIEGRGVPAWSKVVTPENPIFAYVGEQRAPAAAGILASPLMIREAMTKLMGSEKGEILKEKLKKLGIDEARLTSPGDLDQTALEGLFEERDLGNATADNLRGRGVSQALIDIVLGQLRERRWDESKVDLLANLRHGAHANKIEERIEINLFALYALDSVDLTDPAMRALAEKVVDLFLVGHEVRHFNRTGYPDYLEELENQLEDARQLIQMPEAGAIVGLLRQMSLAPEPMLAFYERAIELFEQKGRTPEVVEVTVNEILADLAAAIGAIYGYEPLVALSSNRELLTARLNHERLREFRDQLLRALSRDETALSKALNAFGITKADLRLIEEAGENITREKMFELNRLYNPAKLLNLLMSKANVNSLNDLKAEMELAAEAFLELTSVDSSVVALDFKTLLAATEQVDANEGQVQANRVMGLVDETEGFGVFDLAVLFDAEGKPLDVEKISFLKDPNEYKKLQRLLKQGLIAVNYVRTTPREGDVTEFDLDISNDEKIGQQLQRAVNALEAKEIKSDKENEFLRFLKNLQSASRLGSISDEERTKPEDYRKSFMIKINQAFQKGDRRGKTLQPKDVTILTTVKVFKGLYFQEPGDFWFTLTYKDSVVVTSKLLAQMKNQLDGKLPDTLKDFEKEGGVLTLLPTITYSAEEINRKLKAQAEYEIKA